MTAAVFIKNWTYTCVQKLQRTPQTKSPFLDEKLWKCVGEDTLWKEDAGKKKKKGRFNLRVLHKIYKTLSLSLFLCIIVLTSSFIFFLHSNIRRQQFTQLVCAILVLAKGARFRKWILAYSKKCYTKLFPFWWYNYWSTNKIFIYLPFSFFCIWNVIF